MEGEGLREEAKIRNYLHLKQLLGIRAFLKQCCIKGQLRQGIRLLLLCFLFSSLFLSFCLCQSVSRLHH